MLSPAQIAQRDGKLTASAVGCLMSGDEEKILNLWRELTGDPSYVREDLSGIWAVQLGSHTEVLNLDWYERRTGKPLARRGDVVVHPKIEWAACTLDAWDEDLCAPVECKHVGGFEPVETILARYAPQAHWQMIVTDAAKCVFSVISGAREPVIEIMDRDGAYEAELMSRAKQFMQCVFDLRPPVIPAAVVAPTKAEKIYDYSANNHWCNEAVTWRLNHQAAKDFSAAEKTLKGLVPADAVRVIGAGIEAKRDKANRLSIKELVQ